MSGFQNVDRETPFLLPPDVRDWLPENHLARFVVDVVDQLDLKPLYDQYSGRGSKAADPAMMVALLFYGYATGIFSSRKLENATYESVPVRYICGNTHPDHDTIANFRKRFLTQIESYFVEILLIAEKVGFHAVGNVSVDGSKFKANASKHSAMSYGRVVELEKLLKDEVGRLLELALQTDADERSELNIPEEIKLRENRLEKIRLAKEEIEKRAEKRDKLNREEYEQKIEERREKEERTGRKIGGKEPSPPKTGPRDKDQYNFTDPDSRIMKSGSTNAFEQDYNAQIAVDQDSLLIVGADLSNNAFDRKELIPALRSIPEEIGKPRSVAADTGYFNKDNIKACEEYGVESFIAAGREKHYHTVERLLEKETSLAALNLEGLSPKEAMKLKLKTKEGKEIYRRRKCTVEPVFGIIKQAMGYRQFLLRGIENVRGEWCLLCSAYNLKRMFNLKMQQAIVSFS